MLHIARQSDRCCSTCHNWNGARIMEEDGYVYSGANIEGACGHLWETGKSDPHCMPLTRPADGACPCWMAWAGSEAAAPPPEEGHSSPRSEGLWLAAKAPDKPTTP